MKKIIFAIYLAITLSCNLYAGQSTIVDAEGYACMGDDKSRKQTEELAMKDAKRKAAESALTYIKSESTVKNLELEKDLVEAYTNAKVRIIEEISRGWYKDTSSGECFRVKIKAEVTPDQKGIEKLSRVSEIIDNPSAPLNVRIWTDKKEYRLKEKIKVYIKGNKPFYACIVYKDTAGQQLQILPNPYRTDNYFNGSVLYEIPSGKDRFDLEVNPPFGQEELVVYASTSPLGDLKLEAMEGIYKIKTRDIGGRVRSVKIRPATPGKSAATTEFVEEKVAVRTER